MSRLDEELLEITADAGALKELTIHPGYGTLAKWIDLGIAEALTRVMTPAAADNDVHHWRGVWTALNDVKTLHLRVAQRERQLRAQKET